MRCSKSYSQPFQFSKLLNKMLKLYDRNISMPWVLATLLLMVSITFWSFNRKKLPKNIPILRISTKPGSLGSLEDKALYLWDITTAVNLGYQKYSRHGKHYLLNTPTGMELVIAPEFLEELRNAPESHVSNLAANNDACKSDCIRSGPWLIWIPSQRHSSSNTHCIPG